VLLALILLLLLPLLAACGMESTPQEAAGPAGAAIEAPATPDRQANVAPTRTPRSRAASTATPRVQGVSGLPTIRYQDLPKQAKDAIVLIDQGGPFPFERDGVTFQNREGLLPGQPRGYYREYTVITPGSRDRGARRIVAGEDGELYYTDDHYESFREVIR
jgi:ribonuclease T1